MNCPDIKDVMFIRDLVSMEVPPLTVWIPEAALLHWRNTVPKIGYFIYDLSLCSTVKETWTRPRELITHYNATNKCYELFTTECGLPIEVVNGYSEWPYFAAASLFIAFVLGLGVALLIFWAKGKL